MKHTMVMVCFRVGKNIVVAIYAGLRFEALICRAMGRRALRRLMPVALPLVSLLG